MPREQLIGAQEMVHNLVLEQRPEVERIIKERLVRSIASRIAHAHIEKRAHAFSTTFHLEMYVMTADELAWVVQEAAHDLQRYCLPHIPKPRGA